MSLTKRPIQAEGRRAREGHAFEWPESSQLRPAVVRKPLVMASRSPRPIYESLTTAQDTDGGNDTAPETAIPKSALPAGTRNTFVDGVLRATRPPPVRRRKPALMADPNFRSRPTSISMTDRGDRGSIRCHTDQGRVRTPILHWSRREGRLRRRGYDRSWWETRLTQVTRSPYCSCTPGGRGRGARVVDALLGAAALQHESIRC
jgi:hypothetical protein